MYSFGQSVPATRALAATLSALAISACCSTKAVIGVVIGESPPLEQRVPGHLVVVCPKEKITLGWGASPDVKTANITDIGSVSLPSGVSTLQVGAASKDYTFSVKGDCEAQDTAKVIVATPNTLFVFTAQLVGSPGNATLQWEAVLPEVFYSPKVLIKSVKLNAPLTVSGWIVSKIDLNGLPHNFDVTNGFTTPWTAPLQLAGTWRLVPKDPAAELNLRALPPIVELQVTLTCE